MKRGTIVSMPVTFGISDWSNVETIEFVFKQALSEEADVLKSYEWEGTGEAPEDNTIEVPWSYEDSYAFEAGRAFYMDTRITLSDGTNLPTKIVSITNRQTLFAKEEEHDD